MTSTAEVSWSVPSQVEFGAVPHRATRRTGVRRARDGEGHYVLGRWGMAEGQSPYVAHDLSHSWLRTTPPVTRDVCFILILSTGEECFLTPHRTKHLQAYLCRWNWGGGGARGRSEGKKGEEAETEKDTHLPRRMRQRKLETHKKTAKARTKTSRKKWRELGRTEICAGISTWEDH
jgi:hypothetical protein